MIFRTATGSIYEVDEAGSRIRRLHGERARKHRLASGDWREFTHISGIEVGIAVFVCWDGNTDMLSNLMTSPVVEVNPILH